MRLFDATVDLRILSYFIGNPSKEEHVNGIARTMKISSSSTSVSCRKLQKEGLLIKQASGNACFYSLNNANPLVKSLKRAWFLETLLRHKQAWENDEFLSVALYGSYSSGEFIEKSDVDILVITNIPEKDVSSRFSHLKGSTKAEVLLTVFSLARWRDMAKKRDRFYEEVAANHLILYGSSIVMG